MKKIEALQIIERNIDDIIVKARKKGSKDKKKRKKRSSYFNSLTDEQKRTIGHEFNKENLEREKLSKKLGFNNGGKGSRILYPEESKMTSKEVEKYYKKYFELQEKFGDDDKRTQKVFKQAERSYKSLKSKGGEEFKKYEKIARKQAIDNDDY